MPDGSRETPRTATFLGSFVHALDEKGRVSLPASFRREATDGRFVLIQAHPPALSLYPDAAWAAVEQRFREMLRHQPGSRLWILSVLSNAVEVTPDSQGRILIPTRLQEAAGLQGQVQLVGSIDKVELWNPDTFAAAASERAEDFSKFAPQIFQ